MTETRFPIESYQALEKRIHDSDLDALLARWEFGAQLLEERLANGGKQLPHGRLDEICDALTLSGAEIDNRIQFAAEYQKDKVPNALEKFHSWYEIVRQGLGRRGLKHEAGRPEVAVEIDRLLLNLADCQAIPRSLRELVSQMTPEQRATGAEYGRCLRDELDALMAAVGDQSPCVAVDDEAPAKVPARRRIRPVNHGRTQPHRRALAQT